MYCEIENFSENGNFLSSTKEFWSGAQVLNIGVEDRRGHHVGLLGVCEMKRRGGGNVAGHQLSIIGAQTTNNLSAARLLGRQRQQQ